MKKHKRYRYHTIFFIKCTLLLLLICFFFSCKNSELKAEYIPIKPIATHYNGDGYAGSKSCSSCHLDIYNSHLKTAHHNTSNIANLTTVKAYFSKKKLLNIGKEFHLKMIFSDSSLHQQTLKSYNNQILNKTQIDIVFGSGTKGQSYLTWQNDKLFQLQASYHTPTNSLINSPGFPNHISNLRAVTPRCIECHTTFIKNIPNQKVINIYEKEELILGIECERCHGPSAKHVGFHLSNPEVVKTRFMLQNNQLTRQQKLDACAICHSGIREQPKKIPFSFITGDKLSEFSDLDYQKGNENNLDVHGNQYGLLTASKCFQETTTMTCITCHNPHKKERGNTNSFNSKCINCHSQTKVICKEDKAIVTLNNNNCIECHMPLLESKSMKIDLKKHGTIPVKVRTHLINIYR